MKSSCFVLACALASAAATAAPPAPTISVGATGIRQLSFNITPVTGATRYELWFRANSGAAWGKYTETAATNTVVRAGVSVHLLDWTQAQYLVKACDSSGCTSSNRVGVPNEKLLAMGFFKSAQATGVYTFGGKVAASADGKTIAVASDEDVSGVTRAGVVNVYRKNTSGSGWTREARLQPSTLTNNGGNHLSGDPIAISSSGDLIAFGSWVNSNGAVYLFRRSGTTWTQSQKIAGATTGSGDNFGYAVKLDDAGKTLAIMHHAPGGVAAWGTVDVYRIFDDASTQFVFDKRLSVPTTTSGTAGRCESLALSGDGQTLMRGCVLDSTTGTGTGSVALNWQAPTTNTDNSALTNLAGFRITYGQSQTALSQTINVANPSLSSYTVPNLASGTWYFAMYAYSSSGATSDASNLVSKVVSGSGGGATTYTIQVLKAPSWVVQSTALDGGTGDGVDLSKDGSQVIVQHTNYGWAYKRDATGNYILEAKLSDFGGSGNGTYRHIAISRDGKLAAIGNEADSAAGLGPIFPPYTTATSASGGVVIHERKSDGTWSVRRAIKPGSTNNGMFGHVVAFGDNGKLLVVGAPRDPSKATGIDGDRNDKSIDWRGGVWIY